MKGKSIIVTLLTICTLIVNGYSGNLSIQPYVGIISSILILILSTFFSSGVFLTGFKTISLITNSISIIIQLLNLFLKSDIISAQLVNEIVTGINVVIQMFFRNYD